MLFCSYTSFIIDILHAQQIKNMKWQGSKSTRALAVSVPEAEFYGEEKCVAEGQMEFWPFITGASTGQLPHSDVKIEGCLVMETPHKGNLIPTSPDPTTFQSHGHVIWKSTVSHLQDLPLSQGEERGGMGTQRWRCSWPVWQQLDYPLGPSRRSREGNSTTAGHTQSKGVLQWQWKSIAINSWANFSDQWVRKRTLGKEKEAPWIAWGRGSPGCCFWGERKGWERTGGWEGREQWKDAEYPKEMPKCSCAKCGPREATRTLFSASREGRVSEGCCNLRATRANSTVVLDTWFQKKSLILLEKLAKLAWSL